MSNHFYHYLRYYLFSVQSTSSDCITTPLLDSSTGMQCFSTKALLMKVCDAPELKRIIVEWLATKNVNINTGSPSCVLATWV
jgi:hypothetical protein